MRLPILAGIINAIIFGFSFMFTKRGLNVLEPMQLLGFRFATAAGVLTLLQIFGVINIKLSRSKLHFLIWVALLQPVAYFIFEIFGVSMLSSSEAGMMIALIPVFVTILGAIFLKEKPSVRQMFFIGISVFGVIFINIMKGQSQVNVNYIGILFILAAAISAAGFNIMSRKSSLHFKPVEITFAMMWIGAIVFNGIAIIQHLVNGNIKSYLHPLSNIDALITIIYLGVMSSVVAFFMVNYTLAKLEASQSAVFANLSTVVSVIAGVVLLGEDFYWFHFVGGSMIILGVWGSLWTKKVIKN